MTELEQLRAAVRDVLDAEVGDDAVVLRRMLWDALSEPPTDASTDGSGAEMPAQVGGGSLSTLPLDATLGRTDLFDLVALYAGYRDAFMVNAYVDLLNEHDRADALSTLPLDRGFLARAWAEARATRVPVGEAARKLLGLEGAATRRERGDAQ